MNALLSYLPRKESQKPLHELFGNQLYATLLPRALRELGYSVDYIDWKDTEFKPSKHYDVFIGHGGYNFRQYAKADKNIYFSSGFEQTMFNQLEAVRFYLLADRRGVNLPPDRQITVDEVSAYKMADAIITLGNDITAASFAQYPRVYAIGGATAQAGRSLEGKDFLLGRKDFLFWSGTGSVHKGLDLLLEAFAGTDCHLHICQRVTAEFREVYKKEFDLPNIHFYGEIKISSNLFKGLADVCDWIISATCCEGCPSAILEGMAHGLIPIVPSAASIVPAMLASTDVPEIRDTILQMSIDTCEAIKDMAYIMQAKAQTYYSPSAFVGRLKAAIGEIV